MKIFSYILMTLSVLTFSIIPMEDPGNDTPVTFSGNKRKRNGHEQQPEDLEDIESFAFQLLETIPSAELEALPEIPEDLYSTLCDAIDSQDHYQAPSSSTVSKEAQVAVLGLLASDALAQKSQEKVARSSSRHLPKNLYHCDYQGCNQAFTRMWNLKRHEGTHTKKKLHKCDQHGCIRAFSRNEDLENHKCLVHTNEKPHKCDYPRCNKAYTSAGTLNKHKKKHTVLLEEAS